MAIAREGYVLIAVATALALGAFVVAAALDSRLLWTAAYAFVLIAVAVAFLFRDPERRGERGQRLILSPADGRIVQIEEVQEPEYLHGAARRISIFLSIFDVHVQRSPVSGQVEHLERRPGRRRYPGLEAEQASVGIDAGSFQILVRQIATGRHQRVVTYPQRGARVEQGDRIGMIRFGSRVDAFLPLASRLRGRCGERVYAGRSVLGELDAVEP
jgi:phosphatidylserine decarboxylase